MPAKLSARDRLIVALDVATAAEAERLAAAVGASVSTLKAGKQLFTAAGPDVVRGLAGAHKVFLDLKFHDIPNTVARAVRSAAALGPAMLTLHAAGGSKMLKAAVAAAREFERPPLLLAVTVLTSLNDEDLRETGIGSSVLDQALRLGALARACGCDGVVTSAREAAALRRELGAGCIILTPGVRPAGAAEGDAEGLAAGVALDDQERVVTPAQAIAAGADYIVVGRPITAAANPAGAAAEIVRQIESAEMSGTMIHHEGTKTRSATKTF